MGKFAAPRSLPLLAMCPGPRHPGTVESFESFEPCPANSGPDAARSCVYSVLPASNLFNPISLNSAFIGAPW